jgi:hypothetical protein
MTNLPFAPHQKKHPSTGASWHVCLKYNGRYNIWQRNFEAPFDNRRAARNARGTWLSETGGFRSRKKFICAAALFRTLIRK